jgi:acyl dehydratase
MNQLSERYLEDFAVGQTFGSGRLRIEGERALAFAAEFDPQPFHLDEAAARRSIFGGLTASGWHTAAVTMRLLVETELKPAGGLIGAGLDECRWPRPVRPGDELRVECEVIEVRPSKSRPAQGLIKLRTTTLNQHDEAVLVYVVNMVVQRRSEAGETLRHLAEERPFGKVVLAGDAQRLAAKTQSANHQRGPPRRQSIEADSACRAEKAMRRSR